jgi:hypothetical protein
MLNAAQEKQINQKPAIRVRLEKRTEKSGEVCMAWDCIRHFALLLTNTGSSQGFLHKIE